MRQGRTAMWRDVVLTCRKMTEMASDYLDRDLPLLARMRFRMHLLMCQHCRRYVDQLAATIALLRKLRTDEADSDVEETVAAVLRAQR